MRIVATGSGGQVGSELTGVVGLDRAALDVADRDAVSKTIADLRPDAIVHCAAWTNVDGCESDEARAFAVNAAGTRNVVEAANECGAFVVMVSTDYVFDGTKDSPYLEHDAPNPLNVYGHSKRAGEEAVDTDRHAIVRLSFLSGFRGNNIVKTILRLLEGAGPLRFVTDQHSCPTFAADVAPVLCTIAAQRRTGIWHVTNRGVVSPFEFARAVAEAAGHDPDRIEPVTTADLPPRPARRPRNAVLGSERLRADERLRDYHAPLRELVGRL